MHLVKTAVFGNFGQILLLRFWPKLSKGTSTGQPKLSKGTSTDQDISYEPGKAYVSKHRCFWTFWQNSAISGGRIWPKLSKGTSTGQDLSYEHIPRSLRPSVTKIQPGKAMFRKTANFGHFGQIRPFPVAESGQNFQKAHLQAKTFHMSLFPGLYDHPLQKYSLEKNR